MAMDDMVSAGPRIGLPTAAAVEQAVAAVRGRVDAATRRAGLEQPPTIVAITKYLAAEAIGLLYDQGIRHFGENRPAQLAERATAGLVPADACWEMVGRLQSRAADRVAGCASRIHTLASDSAAGRLAARAQRGEHLPDLLVQVNVDADPAKGGVPADDLAAFLEDLPDELAICGLMTMPRQVADPEHSRPTFAALRELRERLCERGTRHSLRELSMGTSQDYVVAVEEGATLIRVGSALYTLR